MRFVFVAALSVALAAPVVPGLSAVSLDEVFKGTLVCAKCGLQKADATECQDVLLVDDNGTTTEYYITKNEVAEKSGEACTLKIPATVTGSVSQKDGKTWLTPSKIEKH
jgi:hypothetical protein